MKAYEVNRYSPAAMVHAQFMKADWTSCSDIGRSASPSPTREEYLETESWYIASLLGFIDVVGAPRIRAIGLEFWKSQDFELTRLGLDDVFDGTEPPTEEEVFSPTQLENTVRRCLREVAWLELAHSPDFLIHFGHDLRVVVATSLDVDSVIANTVKMGLFVHEGNGRLPTLDRWRGFNVTAPSGDP